MSEKRRIFSRIRGSWCLVIGMLGGCSDLGGGGVIGVPPQNDLQVHIAILSDAIRLISASPAAPAITEAGNSHRTLAYELSDRTGEVILSSSAADPRYAYVEWPGENGLQRDEVKLKEGLLSIQLPHQRGELVIYEITLSGRQEIGRLAFDPEEATLAAKLLNASTDVLGDPVKIVDHGNAAHNLGLLFLPDGYTSNQMAQFHEDVHRVVRSLSQRADYGAYWGKINVWRLDVLSRQKGIDENGAQRDTAFDCYRDQTITRLIVPGNSNAQAAALELGKKVAAHFVVILANTKEYGGSGGSLAVASVHEQSPQIMAHEMGHSLFRLGDEYDYAGGACMTGTMTFPNVSRSASRAQIPWAALIDAATPLPTPSTARFDTMVGAFAGADGCQTAFRPHQHCLMRSLEESLCPVCRREMDRLFASLQPGNGEGSNTNPNTNPNTNVGNGCQFTCAGFGYRPGTCTTDQSNGTSWYCDGVCIRQVVRCF